MRKIFLVRNSDGQVIKACSTIFKAFKFARDNKFRYDHRQLMDVIELEIDGETWGTHHSFEEIEES